MVALLLFQSSGSFRQINQINKVAVLPTMVVKALE
jgi:hypothetical protein